MRGGPGFEMLFNVHTLLQKKKIRDNFELTMFAPMPKPGARMGNQALNMMGKMFERTGIKRSFGKKIKRKNRPSISNRRERWQKGIH
mgnify:CR=1 FL=1